MRGDKNSAEGLRWAKMAIILSLHIPQSIPVIQKINTVNGTTEEECMVKHSCSVSAGLMVGEADISILGRVQDEAEKHMLLKLH